LIFARFCARWSAIDPEDYEPLVDDILATLEGASSEALFMLAAGLRLAATPVSLFASPIFDLALNVEIGEGADALTRMRFRMRH
jgi:hypothetical protein